MTISNIRSAVLGFLIVLVGALPNAAADAAVPIGRLVELSAEGLALDAGRWIMPGPRPIVVLDHAAELELSGGPRLRLDANTAIVLERRAQTVEVSVLSGRVRVNRDAGRELIGGAGGTFVVQLDHRGERSGPGHSTPDDDAVIDDQDRRVRVEREDAR